MYVQKPNTYIQPAINTDMFKHTTLAIELYKHHELQVIRSWQLDEIATEAENDDSD